MKQALIALAITAVAAAAFAQDARMSPDAIKAAWVGKKVQAQTPKGVPLELRLVADGTASVSGGVNDTGTWRLTDTGYCATWQKLRGGKEGCFTVERRGTGTFVINADGSVNTEVLRVTE